MDMLGEYGAGRGSWTGHEVLDRSLFGQMIDDSQIRGVLQGQIASQALPATDGERLYVLFTEPGLIVTKTGASTLTENSTHDFSGYHSSYQDGNHNRVTYVVMPYAGSPNSVSNILGAFGTMTMVASHELAEAVTDPDLLSGWYDVNTPHDEIGDKASQLIGQMGGYWVQGEWSNMCNGPVIPTVASNFSNPVASTQTAVASSATTTQIGQSVVLTASVTGVGALTGTVTFREGSSTLGTATLSNGKGSLTLNNLAVGVHSIVAAYSGDTFDANSTSAVLDRDGAPGPGPATGPGLPGGRPQQRRLRPRHPGARLPERRRQRLVGPAPQRQGPLGRRRCRRQG